MEFSMLRYLVILMATCFLCSSCALVPVYKPQIQQGNVVTPEMLDKIQVGMNEGQVRYIMGNPVLVNTFSTNHLDYIYTLQKGGVIKHREAVSLTFCNGKLTDIRQD